MAMAKSIVLALNVAQSGALLLNSAELEHKVDARVPHFDAFRSTYKRSYKVGSAEYAMRKSLYEARATAALEQNSKHGALWTAGVSFLWDKTESEFAQLRGWQQSARPGYDSEGYVPSKKVGLVQALKQLPVEKAYTNLNTFSYTPNQGGCGSCWAIAASRVLEAHAEIHSGIDRTFSAQQLVSCVPNPQECGGQGGCRGATVELAYTWVMQNGLANNSEVPYWANESKCTVPASHLTAHTALATSKSPSKGAASQGTTSFGMRGWTKLAENKYLPLMNALVEHGPVAVSAAGREWALYMGGIFNGCAPAVVIDHAVVLIAYGQVTESNVTTKYWTVQNSWGDNWGEGGKIRMLRQDKEEEYCGVNTHPEMGTACKGGPENVTVCGMCGILYDSVVPFF